MQKHTETLALKDVKKYFGIGSPQKYSFGIFLKSSLRSELKKKKGFLLY